MFTTCGRRAPGLSISIGALALASQFSLGQPLPACGDVDLAQPFGVLTLDDILVFTDAFNAEDPSDIADLNGDGLNTLDDILVFTGQFRPGPCARPLEVQEVEFGDNNPGDSVIFTLTGVPDDVNPASFCFNLGGALGTVKNVELFGDPAGTAEVALCLGPQPIPELIGGPIEIMIGDGNVLMPEDLNENLDFPDIAFGDPVLFFVPRPGGGGVVIEDDFAPGGGGNDFGASCDGGYSAYFEFADPSVIFNSADTTGTNGIAIDVPFNLPVGCKISIYLRAFCPEGSGVRPDVTIPCVVNTNPPGSAPLGSLDVAARIADAINTAYENDGRGFPIRAVPGVSRDNPAFARVYVSYEGCDVNGPMWRTDDGNPSVIEVCCPEDSQEQIEIFCLERDEWLGQPPRGCVHGLF